MLLPDERVGGRSAEGRRFDRSRAAFSDRSLRGVGLDIADVTAGEEVLAAGLRRSRGDAEGENERRSAKKSNFTYDSLHSEDPLAADAALRSLWVLKGFPLPRRQAGAGNRAAISDCDAAAK